ncbi:MAG: sugar phosphate isomerase/epimerase family protein [Fimbriiglobus sp.]
MNRASLGVALEATGLPLRSALPLAAGLEVRGVQLEPIGELAVDQLTETGRRELKTLLRGFNVELTALNCPIRRSLDDAENLQARLEQLSRVMKLSADLGPRRILVPMPELPKPDDTLSPKAMTLRESLTYLAGQGDKHGVMVGLEFGLDTPEAVNAYLSTFDSGSLGIHFDPANFLMNGHDPMKALPMFRERIIHIQARDGMRRSVSGGVKEATVGQGDIDWMMFAALVESIEYRGFIVVDREQGTTRWADIAAGVECLKRFFP